MEHGRLLPPPTPGNMTLREFGQSVMRWGSGDIAARARITTLTREELERAGLTREMAEAWRDLSDTKVPEIRGTQVLQVDRVNAAGRRASQWRELNAKEPSHTRIHHVATRV